jgi:GT2 family glycosyltransferase
MNEVRVEAPRQAPYVEKALVATKNYKTWVRRFDELRPTDLKSIQVHIATRALNAPLVLVQFDHRSERNLRPSIHGLQSQLLGSWRAVLHFDKGCSAASVAEAQEIAQVDPRIAVMVDPEDIDVLGHDENRDAVLCGGSVVLREHALYMFALSAEGHEAALIYSDEDFVGDEGERQMPRFKPDYSPHLFANSGYFGNCVLVRAPWMLLSSIAKKHFATDCEGRPCIGASLGDLAGSNIIHVSHILFHDTLPPDLQSGQIERDWVEGASPYASIIIPTRDNVNVLQPCIESIVGKTNYPTSRFETIVVDNGSCEDETLRFLESAVSQWDALRVIREPGAFNFAKLNNRAAAICGSDLLVFVNNDTLVIDPMWLRRLASFAVRMEIGVVGAKLLYADGRVQHGGVVVGIQRSAAHCHVGILTGDAGFQGLATTTHEVSAVTAACMAMRREVFDALGGFDERFAVSFNDIDICLRALEKGYRNVYVGEALMVHHEGSTRGADTTPEKRATFRREARAVRLRHARAFRRDPYYNENLSVDQVYELAFPPRRDKPWREEARRSDGLRVLLLFLGTDCDGEVGRFLDLEAKQISSLGHRVVIGSFESRKKLLGERYQYVSITVPQEAAVFAAEADVDCIVAHDPSAFAVVEWLGDWPKVICCGLDGPPSELLNEERDLVEAEALVSASMAHAVIQPPSEPGWAADPNAVARCVAEIAAVVESIGPRQPNAGGQQVTGPGVLLAEKKGDIAELGRKTQSIRSGGATRGRRRYYAALRGLKGAELVERAYLAVLGRYADRLGREYYLERLSGGMSEGAIVAEIALSEEARGRGVSPWTAMREAGVRWCDGGAVKAVFDRLMRSLRRK